MDTASNKNKWFVDALFGLTFFVGCVGVKYAVEARPADKAEEPQPVNKLCDCIRCEENSNKLADHEKELNGIKLAVAALLQDNEAQNKEETVKTEKVPSKPATPKLDKKIIYFHQQPRCTSGRCR